VGTGRERAQFLLEAQRLQQIAHPSVVKVFAVGELPDGRPFLAMERLQGETLAAVISRGAMTPDLALALFEELARAVAALHAQGLVHRDLKPENVFVVGGRHAVLLDFGIAKDLAAPATTTTQEGSIRGTPAYMAPERFFGQPAGIATDIYELALVLYAMLAGRLPWDHIADPEARLAPKPIEGIAEALDVEIRRALSTRVQNRPASAEALLAAVRASASAETPEAGETARMRPGATDAAPEGASPRRTASDGAATLDARGGPTPLAWAPTAPATPQRPRPRARRWPFAILFVTALAGGIAAWRLRANETPVPARNAAAPAPISQPAAHDPWNEPPPAEPTNALPLVEPRATAQTYRAEAASAIARLPASTKVVFTVQLGELRAHDSTAAVLERLGKDPRVGVLAASLPDCVRSLATDAEWLAVGAQSLRQSSAGTIVLRGRWRQRDVEACFDAGDFKATTTKDGAKLYRIGEHGWLDFIDEHTVYVSVHDDRDAEAAHQQLLHGAGPAAHVRGLIARLPADRSITLVVDGAAKDDWSDVLPIPSGSDLFGWVRVEKDGLAFDIAVDTHTLAAAQSAEKALSDSVAPVVKTIEVVRDKAIVHARGSVNDMMIGLLSAGVSQ
jgi:serine/threonine protein kinase